MLTLLCKKDFSTRKSVPTGWNWLCYATRKILWMYKFCRRWTIHTVISPRCSIFSSISLFFLPFLSLSPQQFFSFRLLQDLPLPQQLVKRKLGKGKGGKEKENKKKKQILYFTLVKCIHFILFWCIEFFLFLKKKKNRAMS